MRDTQLKSAVVILCAGAVGCVPMDQKMERNLAAEKLAGDPASWLEKSKTLGKKEELGQLAIESEIKCNDFLKRLTLQVQSVNAAGDISTTVFSALGTVFTPLNTVHGLTAASTISSGVKNSLVADLYAKASIANFQNAIQQTYSVRMARYIDSLPALDESSTLFSAEASKVQSIHALCGLAQAEATIAAQLAPNPAGKPPPISVDKRFSPSSVAINGNSTLTLTLGNSSGAQAALTAAFSDKLPDGLTIATPNQLAGTCQKASIVATPGSSMVTYSSGATVPDGGCTIVVAVTAKKTGSLANSVDAGALQTNQGSSATEAKATLQVNAAGSTPAATTSGQSAAESAPSQPPTRAATWGQRLP